MHLRGLSYEEKTLIFFFFLGFQLPQDQGNIFAEKFSFWLDATRLASFRKVLASWLLSRFAIL